MEKYISIKIEYDNDGNETIVFDTKGFNEFEVIGALTYYRDKVEIESMRRKKNNPAKANNL